MTNVYGIVSRDSKSTNSPRAHGSEAASRDTVGDNHTLYWQLERSGSTEEGSGVVDTNLKDLYDEDGGTKRLMSAPSSNVYHGSTPHMRSIRLDSNKTHDEPPEDMCDMTENSLYSLGNSFSERSDSYWGTSSSANAHHDGSAKESKNVKRSAKACTIEAHSLRNTGEQTSFPSDDIIDENMYNAIDEEGDFSQTRSVCRSATGKQLAGPYENHELGFMTSPRGENMYNTVDDGEEVDRSRHNAHRSHELTGLYENSEPGFMICPDGAEAEYQNYNDVYENNDVMHDIAIYNNLEQ